LKKLSFALPPITVPDGVVGGALVVETEFVLVAGDAVCATAFVAFPVKPSPFAWTTAINPRTTMIMAVNESDLIVFLFILLGCVCPMSAFVIASGIIGLDVIYPKGQKPRLITVTSLAGRFMAARLPTVND
jgi:hypothetical protein